MSEKKVMLKVRNLTKEFKIRGKKLGEKTSDSPCLDRRFGRHL